MVSKTQVSTALVSMKFRSNVGLRKLHILVSFLCFFVYLVLNLHCCDFQFCGVLQDIIAALCECWW